jgi:hypothetical protein
VSSKEKKNHKIVGKCVIRSSRQIRQPLSALNSMKLLIDYRSCIMKRRSQVQIPFSLPLCEHVKQKKKNQ